MNHLTAQELALYLGCDVVAKVGGRLCKVTLRGITAYEHTAPKTISFTIETGDALHAVNEVKPILRRFSSMTEEEYRVVFGVNRILTIPLGFTPQETKTLLSLHFDLFGYIDSGKALDKATL